MTLRSLSFALFLIPVLSPVLSQAQPGPDPRIDPARAERGYVGAATCGECHQKEMALWKGSHHDLSMREATPETVLGDFGDAELLTHGVRSRFFRRDGRFFVHTDGPDGALGDYPVRYTFGWYPLQQYLIELPGGRLQSLGLAWDSRSADSGGQRWFHLYPDEPMDHRNPLHWTARDQTWNYQCADCHSTDLQKRYDPAHDAYDTRYAEINVACEACHGPGLQHVEWARAQPARRAEAADATAEPLAGEPVTDAAGHGLLVDLKDRDGGVWQLDPQTDRPVRSVPRTSQPELQVCAPCHSRRGRIWQDLAPGDPLHQGFRLSLLEPHLYFPDGQSKDEVFVFGSFIQSPMYRQGVVCGDCHDPHSLKLRAEGNAVCARCHVAARYDTVEHHHHQPGTAGAACVACHMAQRYYMVVDERADHSMRVPRPDLTLKIGSPNACNGCHQDQDAAWAATAVERWYPDSARRGPHFGEALHAADTRSPGAVARLLALAGEPAQPAIARASALARLHDQPQGLADASTGALIIVRPLLADPDALVRSQAVRLLDQVDLQTRVELAWPLLSDPARTVRLEAARVLTPVLRQGIGGKLLKQMGAALEEAVAAERVNADRPEAHLNLGLLAAAAGEAGAAEEAYRTALGLDARFTPARANLADLYRALGRESAAEAEIEAGLAADPQSADLHFALGLAQVRGQRLEAAVESLRRAAALAPGNSRYAYVYAVALDGAGRTGEALAVLASARERDPANRDLLVALIQYHAKLGQHDAAARWLEALAAAAPEDPAVAELRALVEQSRPVSAPAEDH
jgi:predicted CXXCH cytochrome family protein